MSKPTLYTFASSVWASVPDLAIRELGYGPDAFDVKVVNLFEAQNFELSFLKINEHGTIPTLTAGGKTYKTTDEVVKFLVENAPNPSPKASGTDLIKRVHEDAADPNFASLSVRSDNELKAKIGEKKGPLYLFITNRQKKLEGVSTLVGADAFSAFFDARRSGDALAQKVYGEVASEDEKAQYYAASTNFWVHLTEFILELPLYLPDEGFIDGERPGEDDFHLGGWLARIVASTGASDINGLAGKGALNQPVPPKLVKYWKAWSARESWKEVYAAGLH